MNFRDFWQKFRAGIERDDAELAARFAADPELRRLHDALDAAEAAKREAYRRAVERLGEKSSHKDAGWIAAEAAWIDAWRRWIKACAGRNLNCFGLSWKPSRYPRTGPLGSTPIIALKNAAE